MIASVTVNTNSSLPGDFSQKITQTLCCIRRHFRLYLIPGAGRAHCEASGSCRLYPRHCSAPRQGDSPQASAATGQPLGWLWGKNVYFVCFISRLLLLHKPAGGVRVNHGEGVELPGLGLGEGHLWLGLGLGDRQSVAVFSRDLLLHILHLTIDKNLLFLRTLSFKTDCESWCGSFAQNLHDTLWLKLLKLGRGEKNQGENDESPHGESFLSWLMMVCCVVSRPGRRWQGAESPVGVHFMIND